MIYRTCYSWQMGEMSSNSGLSHSKAMPNLCLQLNGEHRREQDDGQPELPRTLPCTHADPDKELAGILSLSGVMIFPSHLWREFTRWQKVATGVIPEPWNPQTQLSLGQN